MLRQYTTVSGQPLKIEMYDVTAYIPITATVTKVMIDSVFYNLLISETDFVTDLNNYTPFVFTGFLDANGKQVYLRTEVITAFSSYGTGRVLVNVGGVAFILAVSYAVFDAFILTRPTTNLLQSTTQVTGDYQNTGLPQTNFLIVNIARKTQELGAIEVIFDPADLPAGLTLTTPSAILASDRLTLIFEANYDGNSAAPASYPIPFIARGNTATLLTDSLSVTVIP